MEGHYAVNIADLTKDTILATFLLAPVIADHSIVRAEKTFDGGAVLLRCEDEQALAIIDVVRLKYTQNLFRFYHRGKRGGWRRV